MTSRKQSSDAAQIVAVLSRARWAPHTVGDATDATAASRYVWNIALSQALYAPLHTFEIALRNRIMNAGKEHLVFKRHSGIRCWLDANPPILQPQEVVSVGRAKRSLFKRLQYTHASGIWRSHITADGLVAQRSLGFRVRLLRPEYGASMTMRGILWPQLLRSVFPALPHGVQRGTSGDGSTRFVNCVTAFSITNRFGVTRTSPRRMRR
jgi:hypothetical protein